MLHVCELTSFCVLLISLFSLHGAVLDALAYIFTEFFILAECLCITVLNLCIIAYRTVVIGEIRICVSCNMSLEFGS